MFPIKLAELFFPFQVTVSGSYHAVQEPFHIVAICIFVLIICVFVLKFNNFICSAVNHLLSFFEAFSRVHFSHITLSYMLENGQTFQNSFGFHTTIFLKYIWPFFKIMHETVN